MSVKPSNSSVTAVQRAIADQVQGDDSDEGGEEQRGYRGARAKG